MTVATPPVRSPRDITVRSEEAIASDYEGVFLHGGPLGLYLDYETKRQIGPKNGSLVPKTDHGLIIAKNGKRTPSPSVATSPKQQQPCREGIDAEN
jgi:hypothetical protein